MSRASSRAACATDKSSSDDSQPSLATCSCWPPSLARSRPWPCKQQPAAPCCGMGPRGAALRRLYSTTTAPCALAPPDRGDPSSLTSANPPQKRRRAPLGRPGTPRGQPTPRTSAIVVDSRVSIACECPSRKETWTRTVTRLILCGAEAVAKVWAPLSQPMCCLDDLKSGALERLSLSLLECAFVLARDWLARRKRFDCTRASNGSGALHAALAHYPCCTSVLVM
eukprot:scaffold3469_cov246-Pinguiococcus_pyrenoidosus.AAC.5